MTGIFHTLPSIASEQITTAAPPKRPGRRKRISKPGTCSYRGVLFSSKCVHCMESTQFVSVNSPLTYVHFQYLFIICLLQGGAIVSNWVPIEEAKVGMYGYVSSRSTDAQKENTLNSKDILWVAKKWRVLPEGPATSITIDSNQELLSIGRADGSVLVLNALTLESVHFTEEVHSFHVTNLAFCADSSMLVTGSPDSQVCLLDRSRFSLAKRFSCPDGSCCRNCMRGLSTFWSLAALAVIFMWLVLSLLLTLDVINHDSYVSAHRQLYSITVKSLAGWARSFKELAAL